MIAYFTLHIIFETIAYEIYNALNMKIRSNQNLINVRMKQIFEKKSTFIE
jgi:hypothetical protein